MNNVFIIDGKSSDDTLINANSYKSKIPISVFSDLDTGIYNAMNKGLSLASSDYVLFLNSGDELIDNITVKNINFDAGKMIFFRANIVSSKQTKIYPSLKYTNKNIGSWLKSALPNHQAILFPRKFYANNRYNERLKIAADTEFKSRCLTSQGYIFDESVFVNFYTGGLSTTYTFKNLLTQVSDRYYMDCYHGGFIRAIEILFKGTVKVILNKILHRGI